MLVTAVFAALLVTVILLGAGLADSLLPARSAGIPSRIGTGHQRRAAGSERGGSPLRGDQGQRGTLTSVILPRPVGAIPGPWSKLIFDSEFNTASLDTSQWSTGWFGSGITTGVNNLEQDCFDPARVATVNGMLRLSAAASPESCGGSTKPYSSGLVSTNGKFSFTYGYMEARIWLPGAGGISDWPAFWADGQRWPTDGEIDTVEGLGGTACAHFHSTAGGPGDCAPGSYGGSWHTFGADWERGSVTFYYDGTEVWRDTSGITSSTMYLVLDLAVSSSITSPDTAPAKMRVDYVRVWQH
jgi:beta-glucanase (GH16 family)